MLANLVSNAIDASAPRQTVKLTASAGPGGWLHLQVTDEGCGIAPELIDRIFDPYFTTKVFGEDVRGFGLGLTVSQKIVHLHGGTIAVTSEPGRGTVLTVAMPTTQGGDPATTSTAP
jgi:signal transduction histidine kinase